MFNWHGYPYTNFHELNLDWVMEKVSENRDNITDLINKVNSISPSDPVGNAGVLHVGAESGMYATINSAIEKARQYSAPNKRVLIVVHGGVYEESVNLAPNPGIDIIGYNSKIIAPVGTAYPNACLYTCGSGFFAGLTFECSSPQTSYALHYEVQTYEGASENSVVLFDSCSFIGVNGRGAVGIGGGALDYLTFNNCRLVSYEGTVAYLHNHPTRTDNNVFISNFSNCVFEGNQTFAIDDYNKGSWLFNVIGCAISGSVTYRKMETQESNNYVPYDAHVTMMTSGNTSCVPSKEEEYYLSLPLGDSLGTYRRALIPFEKGDKGNVEVVLTNSNVPEGMEIIVQARKHFIEVAVPDTFEDNAITGLFEIRSK